MLQILAACPGCKTQYDSRGKMPGDHFKCRCGEQVTVPRPRLKEALVVRCSNCGASLSHNKANCEFCKARLTSKSQGWHKICPDCFCRLPNEANFCVECGIRIDPQQLHEVHEDLHCPRCKDALQARKIGERDLFECSGCGGTWVPVQVFEEIVEAKREKGEFKGLARMGLGRIEKAPRRKVEGHDIVKYVPCPTCKNLMNRKNFGRVSGVIIDICDDHGIWLDYQELNQIVLFVEKGGMERTRKHEEEELKANAKRDRKKSSQTHPFRPADLPVLTSATKSSASGWAVAASVALDFLDHVFSSPRRRSPWDDRSPF